MTHFENLAGLFVKEHATYIPGHWFDTVRFKRSDIIDAELFKTLDLAEAIPITNNRVVMYDLPAGERIGKLVVKKWNWGMYPGI